MFQYKQVFMPRFVQPSILFFLFAMVFLNASAGDINEMRARQNYILNCQGCHLPDASGSSGIVPNMKDFVGNFLHVPGGREFIVQVPGVASTPIDDEELAELVNWMLFNFSKQQVPENFTAYTASEVGRLRKDPLINIEPIRKDLIDKIEIKLGVKEETL